MVRKIIQLSESQSEAIERRARELQVSFSEMVRRSVDLMLKQQPAMDENRQRGIRAVGYVNSGESDVSTRHDDYLAEAYKQ